MSQIKILSLLKRSYRKDSNRWLDYVEIAKRLNIAIHSATTSLRALRDSKLIRCKMAKNKQNIKRYLYKYRVT